MIYKLRQKFHVLILFITFSILSTLVNALFANVLSKFGLHVLPYPQQVEANGNDFKFKGDLTIVMENNHSDSDQFTANELIKDLKKDWNINARIGIKGENPSIILKRDRATKSLKEQGYQIAVRKSGLSIIASSEEGLFYGTQTLLQLIQRYEGGFKIPGMIITDWPCVMKRAVHYDTKHHQDKASYVKSFLKDLSRYKVNMLVWEWEDKFAYPSQPEIGAPGAFTIEEMQEITKYAKQYHIQVVPLVQGLGHVSYILKWPQYKHLREIGTSNWEFCPLKEGTYNLLFDLWRDAIEATPGSEYIHIGSDETYELAVCGDCKVKSKQIGESGLYQLFINKATDFLISRGRKVMAWEAPMSWEKSNSPAKGIEPLKGLVLTESYDYETPGFSYVNKARSLGFEVFAYDPNPGVVPLMVPYFFEQSEGGDRQAGSIEKSHRFLSAASLSGSFDGMICTSWDDDGLHNQAWMMHFVNAASCSWNGNNPTTDGFRESFYNNYYGIQQTEMGELFQLLNEGVYYFSGTMERGVWHHGEIGKTHLPDLPRGDALEFDPFWNTEYKVKVNQSKEILIKMNKALQIIEKNKKNNVKHQDDLEVFRTSAELIKHTCLTYIDLSNLEYAIRDAHINRYIDFNLSLSNLLRAKKIVENLLMRREVVFNDLVSTWEKTRLPKGFSTQDKAYFYIQDRARHFANRRPDMTFLIYDEQLLDIEGYLDKMRNYIEYFKSLD